ncbi:EAL domain-containing protein [Asticcacaulis sp. SL142]|uniref:EAL domain-containing protein n=1 Tax=Asticcacaulis sp. SL142 TaxID=2995155 RepID=UPI00226C9C1E|nr:EAL domain-containing protein [Asticcacaulis sp. SL142]WAC49577.1 EAL domain-containing protein [Asticcacaulis sp. SL142]
MSENYKAQRDSYIAYSLAAADLLIEVGLDLTIKSVVGAARTLLGAEGGALKGRSVIDLFQPQDQAFLHRKLKDTTTKGRIDPVAVYLRSDGKAAMLVNVGACFIPSRAEEIHLTLSILNNIRPDNVEHNDAGLMTAERFNELAIDIIRAGASKDVDLDMTLVKLKGLTKVRTTLNADQQTLLMQEVAAVLRANSISGHGAALPDDSFGVLTPANDQQAEARLMAEIDAVGQAVGLKSGALGPKMMSIHLKTGNLDHAAIKKALAYITQTFAKSPDQVPPTIEASLEAAMEDTVAEFSSIKSVIDNGDFQIVYQPIVRLYDRTVHHHEALLRLKDGRNLYDTINFSEQIGLIHDLDLAVCQKVLSAVSAQSDTVVAVNISGQSIASPQFGHDFRKLIQPYRNLNKRVMFEITETGEVKDFETARRFIAWLHQMSFRVCLDDFGSGAASYNYLRHFEVDFVKIDGPFLREAVNDNRQRALIRSIVSLSHELGCQVIGEMIENPEMDEMARQLSIEFGQGYLFGRPSPDLSSAAASAVTARRKGASDSWG